MHLAYAISLVRRKLPLLIAGILAAATLAIALLYVNRTYEVTSHLVVRPMETQVSERAVSPDRFLGNQAQVILSDTILGPAAESLGNGTDAATLREALEVSMGTQNDVLAVTVTGDDPVEAQRRLDAIVASVIGRNDPALFANVLWTGEPEVSAAVVRTAVMAAAAALVGGIVLVVLWGAVRRPLLDPRYAALESDDLQVFPRTVAVGPGGSLDEAEVATWLGALANGTGGTVVAADLTGSRVTTGFTERLARREAGRTGVDVVPDASATRAPHGLVVLVGEVGRTTEAVVEDRAAVLQAIGSPTALVLVKGLRGRAARRAAQEVAA